MKDLTSKYITHITIEKPGLFIDFNISHGGGYTPNECLIADGCYINAPGKGREAINVIAEKLQELSNGTGKTDFRITGTNQ